LAAYASWLANTCWQGGLADMLNPEKLKEKQQQLENRAKSRE